MFMALAQVAFRTQLTYRAQLWAMLFSAFLDVVARNSIWSAVYGASASVAGVTLPQMLTYAIISGMVLSSWEATQVVRDVGALIKSGEVASHLLRPLHYPVALLAEQAGKRIYDMVMIGLPVGLVCILIYGIVPPASAGHFLAFIALVLVSSLVIFAIGIIFALLSFWVLDAHSLEWFMRGLMVVFSGGIVPLWFFPGWLAGVAQATPFAFVAYYPMAAYLGRYDLNGTLALVLGGVAWVAILAALIAGLWALLTRRITIMGG